VIAETNQLGDSRNFVYDVGGRLLRQIDRRGWVRQFEFDNVGRTTEELWYENVADAGGIPGTQYQLW